MIRIIVGVIGTRQGIVQALAAGQQDAEGLAVSQHQVFLSDRQEDALDLVVLGEDVAIAVLGGLLCVVHRQLNIADLQGQALVADHGIVLDGEIVWLGKDEDQGLLRVGIVAALDDGTIVLGEIPQVGIGVPIDAGEVVTIAQIGSLIGGRLHKGAAKDRRGA